MQIARSLNIWIVSQLIRTYLEITAMLPLRWSMSLWISFFWWSLIFNLVKENLLPLQILAIEYLEKNMDKYLELLMELTNSIIIKKKTKLWGCFDFCFHFHLFDKINLVFENQESLVGLLDQADYKNLLAKVL